MSIGVIARWGVLPSIPPIRGAVSTSTCRSFATISSGLVSSGPFPILHRLQKPYLTEDHLAQSPGRPLALKEAVFQIDPVENQSLLRNRRENAMSNSAPREVSQEATAIGVVDEAGRIVAEKKIATFPDAIASWLTKAAALHKTG